MILQMKHLFLLYNFNLICFTSSSSPGGFRGRSDKSTAESSKWESEITENELPTFSVEQFTPSSQQQSDIFVNSVTTTNAIIDNVCRMYDIRAQKSTYMLALKRGYKLNNIFKEDSVLAEFMKGKIISDYQNPIKITFVVYVATEYFYSISLCDIWDRTTEDNGEGLENQGFVNENEKRIFKDVLSNCSNTKYEFSNIITSYSEAISNIKSSSELVNQLENLLGSFVEIMFNLADTIDRVKKVSNKFDANIEQYRKSGHYSNEDIRFILYRWIGEAVFKTFNELRQYLNNSNIQKGEYDFCATIFLTPYEWTIYGSKEKPSISDDEKLLWQNVTNLYKLNKFFPGIPSFQVLSKCEIYRYGTTVYPPAKIGQVYIHPEFFINWELDKFFIYVKHEE